MSIISVLSFQSTKESKLIDARGPRFGAFLTTIILTSALAFESLLLVTLQLIIFALGAFVSPQATPYSWLYRKLIKPRLKGDLPTEDIRPPQFAQLVGFLFTLAAASLMLLDLNGAAVVVIGFALAAAFLNAAFNFCLGCEIYLLIARLRHALRTRKNREDSYNLPSL